MLSYSIVLVPASKSYNCMTEPPRELLKKKQRIALPGRYMECFRYIRLASMVILVFNNLLIGQLAFASAAAVSNCSLLMPGTFAFSVK